MPRWAQSVRFRLSLSYALVVLAVGSAVVGGLYVWQVRQLSEPTVSGRPVVLVDPVTGTTTPTPWVALTRDEQQRQALQRFERAVNQRALEDLRRSSLVAVTGVALVSFGVGWLLAGWAFAPVGRLSAVARDISATDLSRRVALDGPDDELKELADTFDGMLDRLQEAFEGQRRFLQEASHELRNPLSVARAHLDLALDDPEDRETVRRSLVVAHRATDRMGHLVDDLLASARADAPVGSWGRVELGHLVAETVADFTAAADSRGLRLVGRAEDGVVVAGDGPALRRALANLVANAVRLAPSGTTVTVSCRADGETAVLSVADEGPGVAPEHREAVFERFWRSPEPSGDGPGTGLGLTIVRQITHRHGGEVTLQSERGRGSTFEIRLARSGP
jgi:signal transduction histidine kinase